MGCFESTENLYFSSLFSAALSSLVFLYLSTNQHEMTLWVAELSEIAFSTGALFPCKISFLLMPDFEPLWGVMAFWKGDEGESNTQLPLFWG